MIKLNATQIKVIAIVAMTTDHIAFAFVPSGTALYFIMRCIGRLTAPLMSFLMAEGFRYTRSRKKYLSRLITFAIISQPIYYYFLFGKFPDNFISCISNLNVMFTLAIGLLCLIIIKNDKLNTIFKIFFFSITLSFAQFCDWSYMIPIWILIFSFLKKKDSFIAFSIVSTILLPLLFLKNYDSFLPFSYSYGVIISIIPLLFYDGKRQKNESTLLKKEINRWIFYVYYPLHMLLIAIIFYKNVLHLI